MEYILHQYRAKDPDICSGAAELCTARMPIGRLRPKSRVSSSLAAHLLYFRSSLRMPPARVCCHMASFVLDLTPQRFYENLGYNSRFFDILQECSGRSSWTAITCRSTKPPALLRQEGKESEARLQGL